MAEKRPADTEPSEETLAVCTNCSNISNNLSKCELCGSELTESSASRCPPSKRVRSEATTADRTNGDVCGRDNGEANPSSAAGSTDTSSRDKTGASSPKVDNTTSDNSTKETTAASSSKENSPAAGNQDSSPAPAASARKTPSPVDKNQTSIEKESTAPPKETTSANTASAAPQQTTKNSTPPTTSSTTAMNGAPVPQMLYVNNSTVRGPAPSSGGGPTPVGPPIPTGPPIPSGNAVPLNMFVNVNNQAVPIPSQAPTVGSSSAGGVDSSNTMGGTRTRSAGAAPASSRPSAGTGAPPSYSTANTPSSGQSTSGNVNKFSLVIDVHQIRVGVRKFLPMPNSSVLFKDDGVLFTLKEYPNAPLLLNARAIQQCKASLSPVMPALFFYLEGSCIKQIRNIFKMNNQEFSEKANDRVSTISLFPTAMDANRAQGIRTAFDIMQQKFNRPQNLLKEVSVDTIIDYMFGYPPGVNDAPVPSGGTQRTSQPPIGPPPLQSIPNNRVAPASTLQSQIRAQPSILPAASQMLRTVAQQAVPTGHPSYPTIPNQMHPMIAQRQARPTPTVNRSSNSSLNNRGLHAPAPLINPRGSNQTPPLLTIPEDHEQWNNVKKKLVPGGVYQVQTRDGQRKYCLWNGTTLVPCLVQDQEVQLKCDYIRVGSLRCKSMDTVRIRNDGQHSGIYFKFHHPQSRISDEIFISQEDLVDCLVCFDRLCAMFVYPTANCANKIRMRCRMTSMAKDPTYNPFSKEERRRHLILFLKDVSVDQKDSLLKMKRSGVGENAHRHMCRQIDPIQALQILSTMKQNAALSQPKLDNFLSRGSSNQNQDLESLARDLQNPDGSDAGADPTSPDDDDDDVIMTQEEIGVKCPYTQQVMKEPIKNKICGHNYEKAAILEFIARRKAKGNARCPYAGCGNQKPLCVDDLIENVELKQYILKGQAEGTLNT